MAHEDARRAVYLQQPSFAAYAAAFLAGQQQYSEWLDEKVSRQDEERLPNEKGSRIEKELEEEQVKAVQKVRLQRFKATLRRVFK